MMERINGKLIVGALNYLETIHEGNTVSIIDLYKQLYSDVLIKIITGPITANGINIKVIEDFTSNVNEDSIKSDAFKKLADGIEGINTALKENKASNLYLLQYKLADNYSVLISVVDRSADEHILKWCDNGCIMRCSKDGKMAAVILLELETTDDRKRRYMPMFHELGHAIISVECRAYLDKIIPDITDDEYMVFDEILVDIVSLKHLSGTTYPICVKVLKEMGYEHDILSKEVDRICDEIMEEFENQKLTQESQ